ncbi:zinc finger protein 540-like [Battus philenor]|uniref:zinc finger protein 540-like n=1 Tax=Battus philenor TaxID=42288 RepID=UPI0035CF4BE8
MDVVVAKRLDTLGGNWAARESDVAIANGALAFSVDPIGRKISKATMREIQTNYKSNDWGYNGPGAITRVLKKICFTSNVTEMSARWCGGFQVYGPELFYPIRWRNARDYFIRGELKNKEAYVYHVWNHYTKNYVVAKNSPYATLATKKLMFAKLDKTELDRINHEKFKNLQEKHKYYKFLRNNLNKGKLKKDCRLCLKPGVTAVFDETHEFNFVDSIKNMLGIEICKDDGKPQYICEHCESTIKLVSQLKETAEITQWRLQQELQIDKELSSECDTDICTKIHGGYFNVHGLNIVREWSCSNCRRVFLNKEEFNKHELLPSCRVSLRNYICETCSSQFKSLSQLNRHRLIHTGELSHRCVHCPYRARTKYALSVHSRLHSGERPMRCQLCPATFPNASNLASHRRRHMPPAFHCDICQRGFKFKEALHNHTASQHRNAKPYNCSTCGKSFATRKMIRHHERKTHNRPKLRSGVTPIYMRQHEDNT